MSDLNSEAKIRTVNNKLDAYITEYQRLATLLATVAGESSIPTESVLADYAAASNSAQSALTVRSVMNNSDQRVHVRYLKVALNRVITGGIGDVISVHRVKPFLEALEILEAPAEG